MVIGICPKCKVEKPLQTHLFSGNKEVVSLCFDCEKTNLDEIKPRSQIEPSTLQISIQELTSHNSSSKFW